MKSLDYERKPTDSERMSAPDIISIVVCCLIFVGSPGSALLVFWLIAFVYG